ncbi:aspartyl-phosphate phosphatase Spo0E family protein [Brevibacillus laterosporus]|uniref:Aspartyl-phosphate phosphatase Spo0E family protein n=1 Tax=Brevibacillus laterosporus TaxID=1465 RepID=A0A502HQ74_BRELA|nr:aspartyl-phosphate phosphatase Spo0E family protein [Brevibacillus laterosporus]QDX92191.1 aspartyl-phosphate phosphatase Spo0E family protein [Brevibacillus laterosporus]TPG71622.1 aspartyl-phosphate phosphatase Spo0E family protein [Brevibacillus laterosporus]TPG75526.1 aspartyl-phosphate phosphatase Spo0E family protein [Brevibacillus laterosporus]
MTTHVLYHQIEVVRKKLNEKYKHCPSMTPELLELSVKLDDLLNQWQNSSFDSTLIFSKCKASLKGN